jgi:hypothetical protein
MICSFLKEDVIREATSTFDALRASSPAAFTIAKMDTLQEYISAAWASSGREVQLDHVEWQFITTGYRPGP